MTTLISTAAPVTYQCLTHRGSKTTPARLGWKHASSGASSGCWGSGQVNVPGDCSPQCMKRKLSVAMTVLKSWKKTILMSM